MIENNGLNETAEQAQNVGFRDMCALVVSLRRKRRGFFLPDALSRLTCDRTAIVRRHASSRSPCEIVFTLPPRGALRFINSNGRCAGTR